MLSNKIHICYLANISSVHVQRWIKYFTEKGYQVGCLTPRGFPLKFLDIILNIMAVKKWVRKMKPDILHAHYAGVNGVLGALSGFHPFMISTFGSDILIAGKSRLRRPLIKFGLDKADLVTCNADHMREAIINLGVESSKVKVVRFGLNVEKFSLAVRDEELIKTLRVENSPVVISVRNLRSVYNVETLVRAVPLVLKTLPQSKFIIAGEGEEKEKLINLAKELGVLNNIKFVGWLSENDLLRYLKISDVYVSTSLSDGSSMSLVEAMAAGIFPIVSDIPANREWIKNNVNGFLCPTKDHNFLAKKISEALRDKNFRQETIKKNRILAEEKESYQKNMQLMEKYYLQLIQSKK